jgi:hypothetical protein
MRDTATAVGAHARAAGGSMGGAIEGAGAAGGGPEGRGRERKLVRIVCARGRA